MQQWEHCVIGRTIGTYSPEHNWNNYKYFNILKSENNVHTFWHVKKNKLVTKPLLHVLYKAVPNLLN